MTEKKPRLRCHEAFAFNPTIAYVNNELCVCVSRIRGSSIPLSLAKFSKRKYSPRNCLTLSLITPQYYRNRGESNEMSDLKEGMATYDCKGTDASMTIQAKPGVTEFPVTVPISEFTTESGPCWMISMSRSSFPCRDARGASTDNLETYRYFNNCGLDAVSYIPDFHSIANAFSYRLGADIGSYCKRNLGAIYKRVFDREFLEETQNAVHVQHGPVSYVDDKATFLNSYEYEDGTKATMDLFVKDSRFAIEKEYRFVISTWGELKADQFLLPISDELGSFFTFPRKLPLAL